MACRIDRSTEGKILRVYDPQGNESQLFNSLAKVPGNTLEKALEQYLQTLEPEITFQVTPINNGLTSHMFLLGDERIGSIRTKPFKDGVKIDQVTVKPSYQNQGIGTELYLETIRNLMIEGQKLYSDDSRTAPAEKIWQNLVRLKLAEKVGNTYETVKVDNVTKDTTIDEVIEVLKGNVYDLNGQIADGETVAYNSEVGNIYYSINQDGDMSMVKPSFEETEDIQRERQVVFQAKGNQYATYKEALKATTGEDIKIGVVKNGEFVALETRSSNTNPKSEIGWINNSIKEGVVNDQAVLEDGEVYLEVAGYDSASQIVNDGIVKDFAFENGFKAELRPDGTFQLKNLEETPEYPGKEVTEVVYDNFFKEMTVESPYLETETQLSQKIMSFLEKIGFSVVTLEQYVKRFAQKNGVAPNAEALVDLANQVVAFKEGRITEDSLTEEFAHIILEAIPQEQLQPVLDEVHTTKEWAENYTTYMEIYQDENLVRKEILGKIVAKGLQNRTESVGLFQSIWNTIRNFINTYIKSGFQTEVDLLTNRVHDMLVRQDPSSLEDLSNKKVRLYRVDSSIPDLVRRGLSQLSESERQLRGGTGSKFAIEEALNNIDSGRTELSTVNLLDIANRLARYVTDAIETSNSQNTPTSGEERIVALHLKNVLLPIITKIRKEIPTNDLYKKSKLVDANQLLTLAEAVSDEITRIDVTVSDSIKQDMIDRLLDENPRLKNQTINGLPSREYFEKAFSEAETDTNYLFSWVGLISHAKDPLLNIASHITKKMRQRADFNMHDRYQAVKRRMQDLKIKPKDWAKFFDRDGWIISYWDMAQYEEQLQEAEKESLKAAGIDVKDFDSSKNYLSEATDEQKEIYRKEITERKRAISTQKYTEEFYKEQEEKQKNLSDVTKNKLQQFRTERNSIMQSVKRDSKGRPVFSKQNRLALDEYNIRRKKTKNLYDTEGSLKDGLVLHENEVTDSVKTSDGWLTLDKSKASEDTIVAFELTKFDLDNIPKERKRGLNDFLSELRSMTLDQAKAFVESNINIGFEYVEIPGILDNIPKSELPRYEKYRKLVRKRNQILSNYRDPKNASNILFAQMDTISQRILRDLTDDIANERRELEINGVTLDSESEYGTNESYRGWLRDEGIEGNAIKTFERSLEHVPTSKRVYLNSLLSSLERGKQGYTLTEAEENRLEREFPDFDFDFEALSMEQMNEMKLSAVQSRLAPYFMASTPQGTTALIEKIRTSATVNELVNYLNELDTKDGIELSLHYSYYEDYDTSHLNPNYQHEFQGGRVQPKAVNSKFNEVLGISPGTYTLDSLGIPVMKQGYTETDELKTYRIIIEENQRNLELQGVSGDVSVFQAPQFSRTGMNKFVNSVRNPSQLGQTLTETFNELKNFRVDELELGETDKDGDSLVKQGIRVVPRRYVRKLENSQDVTNDLFYSIMMMTKESELHKARKESLMQFTALDESLTNRKYNKTSKESTSTNTYKMFKSFMDYNLFGVSEVVNYRVDLPIIGTVDLAKTARLLHKYVRDKNLAYNLIVPMTSMVTAQVALAIESRVKQYIDESSILKARKELVKLAPQAFRENLDVIKTGKLSVIAERLSIWDFDKSFENSDLNKFSRAIPKLGYIWHTAGNFEPIMTSMLASLMGHKYYNGQFLNYNDFVQQKRTENPTMSSKDAKSEWKLIENNSFYDFVEVTDGIYQKQYQKFADKNGLTLEEATKQLDISEEVLAIKTQKMSEAIDGQIRVDERTLAQRNFITNFLMTHKGWLSIAIARKFKYEHYNMATQQMEEGHYITGMNALKTAVKSITKLKNPEEAKKELMKIWTEAEPHQRQNLVRFLIEMGFLTSLFALSLGLSGFADDDENRDNWTVQYAAYIMERLVNETRSAQIGVGAELLNSIQEPVVGLKQLRKSMDVGALFSTDEIKSGRYRGLSSASGYLLDVIPGAKSMYQISSGENLNYQRNAYRHYNSPDQLQPLAWIIDSSDVKEMFGN